ncbi:MAG: multiheme c-type cytochrome [bacterium JZ-2024 1]
MKEKNRRVFASSGFWLLLFAFGGAQIPNRECLMCHEAIEKIAPVHEKVACQDCHSDIQEVPHHAPPRRIDCLRCHRGMTGMWAGDPHERARAKGNTRAPDCKTCHGTHDLKTWKAEKGHTAQEHRKTVQAFCATCHPTVKAPEGYHDWSGVSNKECLQCHGNAQIKAPQIDVRAFQRSVHNEHMCTHCHRDITQAPHTPKPKPVDCGVCHQPEYSEHEESVHGQAIARGMDDAAHCWDCHGSHDVLRTNEADSRVQAINLPDTCGKCHTRTELVEKYRIPVRNPTGLFKLSVHYKALQEGKDAAVCNDCHGVHSILPLEDPKSKVYKGQVPHTCGQCHSKEEREFTRSIHWTGYLKGVKDAPVCNDCHQEHAILGPEEKSSPVFAARIPETCTRCHESEIITSRYGIQTMTKQSYYGSYHGLALKAGKIAAANCASCHKAHDVLPSSSPLSSVHPANLASTCGRCHPGIGEGKMLPKIHANSKSAGPGSRTGIDDLLKLWISRVYIFLIVSVIGAMALHNLIHFRYAARRRRSKSKNDL